MGQFTMSTGDVQGGGMAIQNQAEEFGYARKKITDTIEFLLQAYPSSDGAAIAETIKGYDPMLNKMQMKLQEHGDFGVWASGTTVSSNEEIVSRVAKL